jgi:predicted HTH transcriptional regulator
LDEDYAVEEETLEKETIINIEQLEEQANEGIRQYIKAKNMILEYLQTNDQITSAKIQEMCGFTKQQARSVIDKMRSEKLINLNGKGPAARYVIFDGLSDN